MALLQTIALLCQVHPGNWGYTLQDVDKYQQTCQKYYIDCLDKESPITEGKLVKCMMERK